MTDRKLRNYFTALASTIAVLAVVALALTIAVDPYRMWDTREIAGFNAMKPRVDQQRLLAKTYLLERHTPKTLLLGNSRVEVGLDPKSPMWPDGAKPVFNAGIAGAELSTARGLLRDTIAREPVDTIIVGLDFGDVLGSTPRGPPARRYGNEERLILGPNGQANPNRRAQVWKDRLSTTLTIDAVSDSFFTLLNQRPNVSNTMTREGFNPLFPYRAEVEHNGYYELFRQKQVAYVSEYDRYVAPDFSDPYRNLGFRYLAEILRLAASRNVKVILFVYPYHASYLDMVADKGLWGAFEDWKRALVRVVDRESNGRRDRVTLWDFSGYSPYSLEAVPPRGDTHSKMKWYWEAGHFTSDLGNVLIGVMMQGHTEFGHRLDSSNIEDVLAAIRAERASVSLTRVRAELPHS